MNDFLIVFQKKKYFSKPVCDNNSNSLRWEITSFFSQTQGCLLFFFIITKEKKQGSKVKNPLLPLEEPYFFSFFCTF